MSFMNDIPFFCITTLISINTYLYMIILLVLQRTFNFVLLN